MASINTPAATQSQRTGSCLCGAIKIDITGDPVFTNLCHCISCQKASGVVFASIAVFKTEQVEYTATPPEALKTYVDGSPRSGNVIERSFCANCGSRVKNIGSARKGAFVAVPTGILEGDKADLKPRMELFCANREEWLANLEGTATYAGMPTMPPSMTSAERAT